jgi:hypothetical protein
MSVIAPSTAIELPAPLPATERPLIERLAARISCSLDEIAVFPSQSAALDSIERALLAGRRVLLGQPVPGPIATRAQRSARLARTTDLQPVARFADDARDADTVIVSSPSIDADGRANATLMPRDLLFLRSRAPRPAIILDLTEEDRASTPLTQPALLLPGALVLRGFGDLWREQGATTVADLAFVAGPRDLIGTLGPWRLDRATVVRACDELDEPDIDRQVQMAASRLRAGAPAGRFLQL